MSYCPERLWAVLWVPDEGEPWIVTGTIRRLRKDAIREYMRLWSQPYTWRHMRDGITPRGGFHKMPGRARAVIVNVDVEVGWYEDATR